MKKWKQLWYGKKKDYLALSNQQNFHNTDMTLVQREKNLIQPTFQSSDTDHNLILWPLSWLDLPLLPQFQSGKAQKIELQPFILDFQFLILLYRSCFLQFEYFNLQVFSSENLKQSISLPVAVILPLFGHILVQDLKSFVCKGPNNICPRCFCPSAQLSSTILNSVVVAEAAIDNIQIYGCGYLQTKFYLQKQDAKFRQ